jgi:drug/metabolite transporter (DMT)-like permease
VLLVWHPGATVDLGALLVAGACLCWGVDNAVTSRIDQISPTQITLAKGLVAGSANLILGLALSHQTGLTAQRVLAVLVIGALGYGASITLWITGARDLGAARAQAVFATAPFIGALVSWAVLGEALGWAQVVALPLAGSGVVLSLRTAHEHGHVHEVLEHEHEHSHDDEHHDHAHDPPVTGRHTHRHQHRPLVHSHPHVADLHHRHH